MKKAKKSEKAVPESEISAEALADLTVRTGVKGGREATAKLGASEESAKLGASEGRNKLG